jgi:hypothetical protein
MEKFTVNLGEKIEAEAYLTIECVVPEGVAIGKTQYGNGIFATKPFKKGDLLYKGYYLLIQMPKIGQSNLIILRTQTGEYALDVLTHTVEVSNEKRELFYFDGFMNHSCDPTTYSSNSEENEFGGSYGTIASRDIETGDEITCDYDLFELDCKDKGIDECKCGASICRGNVHGFLHLKPEMKKKLFEYLNDEVKVRLINN